nr:helix-turn-helix transcriptional regulator [uncultured Clostridium sp.]
MLTAFGRFLRKLRIDNGELLKDMSEKLNITVAYLSAVENGKRDIPEKWLDIIRDLYGLDDNQYCVMQEAAYENKNDISITLKKGDAYDRNLVLSFAREFRDLTKEEKADIMQILKRNK